MGRQRPDDGTVTLNHLADMTLFVHIVERGSLSGAGRALGLPKATVSRRLAQMEQRLGAPLLRRSTRALTPTDLGRRSIERIRPIVRDAMLAQAEVEAEHAAPAGLLRVSATTAYGQVVVAPRLFSFLAAHPAVRIDLRLTDERVHLVAEGFDLAIRMGRLDDSELVARRIATVPVRLVAAPAYLAARRAPIIPQDLAQHRAILTRTDLDHCEVGGETVRLLWSLSTGNMLVTRDAILQGLGIGLLPAFLADEHISAGRLVPILPEEPLRDGEVHAVWPRSVAPSPAVTALIRHLTPRPSPVSNSAQKILDSAVQIP